MHQSNLEYKSSLNDTIQETWYFFVCKGSDFITSFYSTITDNHRTVNLATYQSNTKIILHNPFDEGTHHFEVHGYCNGYLGLDVICDVSLKVEKKRDQIDQLHPEDKKVLEAGITFYHVIVSMLNSRTQITKVVIQATQIKLQIVKRFRILYYINYFVLFTIISKFPSLCIKLFQ